MKLTEHFDEFLKDIVNLNDTRVEQLDDSIEALKNVVRNSDWKPKIQRFVPQGSWAHKTIIKPINGKAFDADLLVFVRQVEDWDAREYINSLHSVFANHETYKDKVRRYSHCVTIEYAGERKIDLAPCVIDRGGLSKFEVCNRTLNAFELSEPEKYTDWLIDRNKWTTGNTLRKVTRLLKYLRDIKGTFSCTSVLFTTLLGNRIDALDQYKSSEFCDVPTALKTIIGRLDDWLQANPIRPTVTNPVLSSEVFSNSWDDARYANFRDQIHKYRGWIDDAFTDTNREKSIEKWQRVFGTDFAPRVEIKKAARSSESASTLGAWSTLAEAGLTNDLVSQVARYGTAVIPSKFNEIPYKERPRWRSLAWPLFAVEIAATTHSDHKAGSLGNVASGGGPLPKKCWLRFLFRTSVGTLSPYEYEAHWRVTNTGDEAARARCLRGGFVPSDSAMERWESLAYRGVHTVEVFIVRRRDETLVAWSEPFYVVVE